MFETQKDITPEIRHDIKLLETTPAEDGSKQWLIYDPVQNKYFTIGIDSFELLHLWEPKISITHFVQSLAAKGYETDEKNLKTFLDFLVQNHLVKYVSYDDVLKLEYQKKYHKPNFLKWLMHNYLFIKIPLVKPDKWLGKNLSNINFMYSRIWSLLLVILGMTGMIRAMKEWELFLSTFLHFFSFEGFAYYLVSLIAVKSFHELGHAFTAKRHGCHIPSIGVAFMVLMPVLYTDTTNAYLLHSKKKRLSIALAGIKVEIYLAMMSLFLWSILEDGPLKSIAFTTATTSLIASLVINLSPFMRFDGYYALSDLTDTKNLQPRGFAYTKWFLRKNLVGINDAPPELILGNKKIFFLFYSISTWIYRFLLFLGIALLVYYYAFKVLGIILFLVEIVWFILLPILLELKIWWQRRNDMTLNKQSLLFLLSLTAIIILFFFPWYSRVHLPAVILPQEMTDIYPIRKAQIEKLLVEDGDYVQKNQIIAVLRSQEIDLKINSLEKEIYALSKNLKLMAGNETVKNHRFIIEESIKKAKEEHDGLVNLKESLIIKAPFDAKIKFETKLKNGDWVNPREAILTLYNPDSISIVAYCKESDIHRIKMKDRAFFIANNGEIIDIDAKINSIASTSSSIILYPELSSIYKGSIATRQSQDTKAVEENLKRSNLISENAYFRVDAKFDNKKFNFYFRVAGELIIEGEKKSFFEIVLQKTMTFIVKESGF